MLFVAPKTRLSSPVVQLNSPNPLIPASQSSSVRFGQDPTQSQGDSFTLNHAPVAAQSVQPLLLPVGQAKTTAEFITQMEDVVRNSPYVSLDRPRIGEVARSFTQAPKLLDWKGYISDDAFNANPPDLNRALFELALNIANQSGFITVDANQKAQKWEIGGSGAAAMVQVINTIRQAGMLPGIDLHEPADVPAKIGPLLNGVPFRDDRLAIFQEFAQPGAYQAMRKILDQARTAPNEYHFAFDSVKALAQAFPKSFGSDPFYKKASLALLAMVGFGQPRGIIVKPDIPVAADYRLPQTLEQLGILKFTPELIDALNQGQIFQEDDPVVQHLRAASVVASAELSRQSGFDSAAIDGLLWSAARNQAKVAAGTPGPKAKPHLMVPTMRF